MKHLLTCLALTSTVFSNPDWESYKLETLKEQQTIYGWCTPQKGALLMEFIHLAKPQTCVEIGTFLGSATYPIAKALMFNQQGMLHTIDTWNYGAGDEEQSDYDLFANMWKKQRFDGDMIYLDFIARHFRNNLRSFCHPMRLSSLKAANLFEDKSIDFLFLDGDTSTDFALEELLAYFPKVKPYGAIWLNHANLASKSLLVEYLMKKCRHEKNWSYGIECVLFIKN